MENNNPLLIVIDAGHGGEDFGAMWEGRMEKDDNLALSLLVRDALLNQGLDVLMTRDTDVFVTLADRARMANEADADLFVAIHRNSYVEWTPTANGLENYIYLTAPEETSGRAAQLVLDAVVEVGAQTDRGVNRGNYYVLRRTNMPAMLLEMGFIIDETDNRLFDELIEPYAEAIAKGIMQYFGLTYQPSMEAVPPIATLPPVTPVPPIGIVPPVSPVPSIATLPPVQPVPPIATVPGCTEPPLCGSSRADLVVEAQRSLNGSFGANITVDGVYGETTKQATVRALQQQINDQRGAGLPVTGVVDSATLALLPTLRQGDTGGMVMVLQILLNLNGYSTQGIDGEYTPQTKTAVELYQRDTYLTPDGIAGPRTFTRLLV